jgi:hypothetical protein
MSEVNQSKTDVAGIAPQPDSELLRLCGEFLKLEAAWRRFSAAEAAIRDENSRKSEPVRSEFAAMLDGTYDQTLEKIAELPALTPEGWRAKAAVLRAFYYGDDPPPLDYPIDRVAWSLICDISGRRLIDA